MNSVEAFLKLLSNKYAEVTSYRTRLRWRFLQGRAVGAYDRDYDDSTWDEVQLPMRVDLRRGEAWFRCRIAVPRSVAGIPVEGSRAKLRSSVITAGAEVYVDSKLVLSADYWTELRGPLITLSEDVKPGEVHVIALKLYPHTEPISVPAFNILYSRVEDVAFEIDAFIEELRMANLLPGGAEAVEEAVKEFDFNALHGDYRKLLSEMERVRAKLSHLSSEIKRFRVHLVGHAHIDMNWLWPWEDTVKTIRNTFGTMLNIMDRYPTFHFSQSQAAAYKVVEEGFPEMFNRIKRRVEDGSWEVTAGTWVEADLNMGGDEALVRQFLYGKRYCEEKLGVKVEVCWEPDTFGHPLTMPQIVKKSGMRYYYFMRCGRGYPVFWWEGADGSRVLAFNSVYNNYVYPRTVCEIAREVYRKHGLKTSMFVYGVGDHGGGPTVEDVETALKIAKKPLLPTVVFSSALEFFREVKDELSRGDGEVPVVRGELNFTFDGCYTTHADVKRYNRLCERMLVDAEKLCSLAGAYPREKLRDAWRKALFNQFHDILCGSGIHEIYEQSRVLAEQSLTHARDAIRDAMATIASQIGFKGYGVPILVFNTLPWPRRDVVRVKLPSHLIPVKPIAVSPSGETTPVQVHGDELVFTANVPSLGYTTYYIREGEVEARKIAVDEYTLENEFFRLTIDEKTGTIKTLYDKRADRLVFTRFKYEATRPQESHLFQILHEAPHPMSAWIIGEITCVENLTKPESISLVENGPVRARVRVVYNYRRSMIRSDITMCRGVPRVEFHTSVRWMELSNERAEAPMLKASFTPILKATGKATFEVPFGYAERPGDGSEVPALRWVDLSDGEYGLTLLNDSKYGFDVSGNTVRITLLRTSYSPDPKPDQGVHRILYAIYPHSGDWRSALSFRRAYELNHPLEAMPILKPSQVGGVKPDAMSFLNVEPENVVVTCLKKAEDSEDLVIRLYEATGVETEATLRFGFKVRKAQEVDLTEKPIGGWIRVKDDKLTVKLKPLEIKTLMLKTDALNG